MGNIKLDALFIGTHPDDVELTCGGTVIKLIKAGKKVGILDLTLGELSTAGNLKTRRAETKSASEILGIHFRENLKLKDGDIQNNFSNRLKLIKIIRSCEPRIVFIPYPHDRHPDHINAGNFIRESIYFSGLKKIKSGNFDSYRPAKTFYYRHNYDMPVSFIFDISDVFDTKMKAVNCYSTQFYTEKHKKNKPVTFINTKLFKQEIETRARFFGFKIGVEFGEPFSCCEALKADSTSLFNF